MEQIGSHHVCGHCGTVNVPGEQFCSNCGYDLSSNPGALANPAPTPDSNSANSVTSQRITGMLKSGEMLNGRYRVVRLVGKGGFGAVYEAHDVRFQSRRTIAVKEMSNTKLSPAERVQAIKDFRREADLLVQLNHPHLPHVSDFFEESDKAYLVMEFVHGDTLEKVQQDAGGPLDEKRVMEWALQLCDVLKYLHTRPQPIIFRDLKPTNVMVTQDGQIKLIDFGIARIFKSTARQDTNYMGSLGYAPLEQYGSGQTDARSDIYALGATLYDLLTHTTPIDAPARVLHPQNFKTPRQINPGVSNRVERIVLKAMEKDPEDRFQTAAAMYQAIDASRVGAGVVRSGTVTAAAANPQLWAKSFTVLPSKGSKRWIVFVSIPIVVMILLATLLLRFLSPGQIESPDDIGLNSIGPGGIGMYTINAEDVGISDGKYAFDTNRDGKGKDYKIQACASWRAGNVSEAISLWHTAHELDTNDAEPLIYLENQRVLASGNPYITLIVGVLLGTNSFDGYSRDYLQAAYIAQKEYNDLQRLPGGMKVRLLIAKSGSDPARSSYIARLVVKAAQADKTIVGVMGWTTSATSVDVVPILAQSHIPIVSAGVASDLLTNISPYFFRVGPPNKIMTKLLAQYVESKLHPQRLVIFKDSHEAYSLSLSEAFTNQMNADGQSTHITSIQEFSTGEKPAARLSQLVQNTLRNYHPDVIFMTSNSVEDMATLLNAIPSTAEFAQLKVVMGIAGYELTESDKKVYDYNRLVFSSAASPAIWDHLSHSRPIFFNDYPSTFDPLGTHKASPYTYDRPNSFVMLGYDAMLVLLKGSEMSLQGGKQLFTPAELRQAIAQINGSQALHGITGQIDLGRDGDPINKTNFVLHVDDSKHLQIDDVQGCFDDATICAKKAP